MKELAYADGQRIDRDARHGSPGRERPVRTLSRRTFVGAAALATCGLSFGLPAAGAATASLQVWGLDPYADADGCSCKGCAACVSHAANKLFATSPAADSLRAHTGCKCGVVSLGEVDQALYTALFGNGRERLSVDRRYGWVRDTFDHPLTRPVDQNPAPGGHASGPVSPVLDQAPSELEVPAAALVDNASVEPAVEPPVKPASATVRSVRIVAGARRERVLSARIVAAEPVMATVTLTRLGAILASRTTHLAGPTTIGLSLPRGLPAGPAALVVRIRDRQGAVSTITKRVRLPR